MKVKEPLTFKDGNYEVKGTVRLYDIGLAKVMMERWYWLASSPAFELKVETRKDFYDILHYIGLGQGYEAGGALLFLQFAQSEEGKLWLSKRFDTDPVALGLPSLSCFMGFQAGPAGPNGILLFTFPENPHQPLTQALPEGFTWKNTAF